MPYTYPTARTRNGHRHIAITVILALAGDTMLGRGIAERLRNVGPAELLADDLVAVARAADWSVSTSMSGAGHCWPLAYEWKRLARASAGRRPGAERPQSS